MADVSRDRAQLIIVSALALAVTLVALAIILNSAIFTGNLSTREDNHDTRAVVEERATVNESVSRAINYVNTHNGSDPDQNLTEEMVVINSRLRRQTQNGIISHATVSISARGTRMAQLNATRDFTAGGTNDGDPDWTLIDGTGKTRQFRMRLNKSKLYNADSILDAGSSLTSTAYNVEVENSTGHVWEVYIYQSTLTGNAYLITNEPGGAFDLGDTLIELFDGSCAAGGPQVHVDFVSGTFGPAPDVNSPWGVLPAYSSTSAACSELSWYDPSEDYEIRYTQTETPITGEPTVAGKYELIVSKDYSTLTSGFRDDFYEVGSGNDPFAHGVITGADVSMEYRTNEVTYSTSWTTTPARQQLFTGLAPTIDQFDVNDQSSADFDVNWAVSDQDDDLALVNLTLYDLTDDTVDDSVEYSVSGSSASGSDHLESDESSDGNEYEIRIRVEDQDGHIVHREKVRST